MAPWKYLTWLIIVAVFIAINVSRTRALAHTVEWNYKSEDSERGPTRWHVKYPECGGESQSPVMINTRDVIYDPLLQPLNLSDYAIIDGVKLMLENVGGRTAEVIVKGREIFLRGGSLQRMYKLVQLHFHWGKNNMRGSEHSLNGQYFPLEVHFVHMLVASNSNENIDPKPPKRLAVVAFFFRMGRTANVKYETLLRHFDKIQNADAETRIPILRISDLLPSSRNYHYFRYQGSLTTPPCNEIVTWFVGIDTIIISDQQLDTFRTLYDQNHQPLVDCFRPIQSMNNRTIYTTNKSYGNAPAIRTIRRSNDI